MSQNRWVGQETAIAEQETPGTSLEKMWFLEEVTAHHKTRALHTVVADLVIWREEFLAVREVLLIERLHEPFKGAWALPGGFVEPGEATLGAALREGREETGVVAESLSLVGVYDTPGRDPRGPNIGVAYKTRWFPRCGEPKAGDDAKKLAWFNFQDLPDMAFDHKEIVEDAMSAIQEEERRT